MAEPAHSIGGLPIAATVRPAMMQDGKRAPTSRRVEGGRMHIDSKISGDAAHAFRS